MGLLREALQPIGARRFTADDYSIHGSGNNDLIGNRGLQSLVQAFGAALANQQLAHAFQQVGGGIHSLRKKDVGTRIVVVEANLAGDQDGRPRNNLDRSTWKAGCHPVNQRHARRARTF